MIDQMYVEQLDYISRVTHILNENMPETSNDIGFYVHVELRDETSHKPVGYWSDEISHDCWAYVNRSPNVE